MARLESVKQRVLKVTKPASTAVLEISATRRDPRKAQALAQYVAGADGGTEPFTGNSGIGRSDK